MSVKTDIPEITFTQPADFSPQTELLMYDKETLVILKQYYQSGDEQISLAVADLIKKADAALESGPYSVMHKTGLPPGGDKHDYYSLGIYYWPDPFKVSGLPYIRRDGRVNPESYSDVYDKKSLIGLFRSVGVLSLAYYYTEKLTYLEYAAVLLRTWFLDPKTRMNPHLSFAQIRPGSNSISGSGGW
ncbi:MAG: alginate lyase family protein [Spirochaetales bacterium]|nr:alginate lyase family protein [Spirochaetales bacterium]